MVVAIANSESDKHPTGGWIPREWRPLPSTLDLEVEDLTRKACARSIGMHEQGEENPDPSGSQRD